MRKGKKLLVIKGEQGIGTRSPMPLSSPDAARDNTIAYECDHRLEGLMKRSLPGVEVHGTRFTKAIELARDEARLRLRLPFRLSLHGVPKALMKTSRARGISLQTLKGVCSGGRCWTRCPVRRSGSRGPVRFRYHVQESSAASISKGLLPILKTPGISFGLAAIHRSEFKEIAEFDARNTASRSSTGSERRERPSTTTRPPLWSQSWIASFPSRPRSFTSVGRWARSALHLVPARSQLVLRIE
jgi:hypothetical protein